jgi:hypothetical protein
MSVPLASLTTCFQGLIPATLYTCSRGGEPNVSTISHIDYVDPTHVALSFQFFNKSRRNIAENPLALVRVFDPDTGQCYGLRLRFARSETQGPIFESMFLRIEAIASHSGLKGIFKLRAADIYEVLGVEKTSDELGIVLPSVPEHHRRPTHDALFTMTALQALSERIHRSSTLETLLDSILDALDEQFGFGHAMILLAGEQEGRLFTIASRGYPESGVGSEVGLGEGIIGMVAEAHKPIRVSGLVRELLYAAAVAARARAQGMCPEDRWIPLPGLPNPQSQLGIPLLVRGELVGVLCAESEVPYRFHEEDKAYFEVLGSYLAIAIQNILLRERAESDGGEGREAQPTGRRVPNAAGGLPATASRSRLPLREVTYYRGEELILVGGDYLIRSLPARILWKVLTEFHREGRTEFSNRELRLDKSLNLPQLRDNLETRLLLLRRRLEQRCPEIRLVPCARGRFALELACELTLAEAG